MKKQRFYKKNWKILKEKKTLENITLLQKCFFINKYCTDADVIFSFVIIYISLLVTSYIYTKIFILFCRLVIFFFYYRYKIIGTYVVIKNKSLLLSIIYILYYQDYTVIIITTYLFDQLSQVKKINLTEFKIKIC